MQVPETGPMETFIIMFLLYFPNKCTHKCVTNLILPVLAYLFHSHGCLGQTGCVDHDHDYIHGWLDSLQLEINVEQYGEGAVERWSVKSPLLPSVPSSFSLIISPFSSFRFLPSFLYEPLTMQEHGKDKISIYHNICV